MCHDGLKSRLSGSRPSVSIVVIINVLYPSIVNSSLCDLHYLLSIIERVCFESKYSAAFRLPLTLSK